jgi:cysteine desulfurase
LISAIEHDSIRAAGPAETIPVTADGILDLDALAALLAKGGPVSVMAANNETGIIQPIAEIVRIAHDHGALVHCDAIQALGKIGFDMGRLGVDLATVSAHKLGGPQGVGALAMTADIRIAARQRGGGQERGARAGTENLPGIAGFAAAAEAAVAELADHAALALLRDGMEAEATARLPMVRVFGAGLERLPNTSAMALPGVPAELQIIALDLAGVGVSAGAACSSGKVRPSHVLEAMGVAPDLARSAIRVSLGRGTTRDEIELFLDAWVELAERQRGLRARHGGAT